MTPRPVLIEAPTVSEAWAQAFSLFTAPGVTAFGPLAVTINVGPDNSQIELESIRQVLDQSLESRGQKLTRTVANTIFPHSMWNPSRPRQDLFDRYLRALSRLKRASPANKYGLYFERMIRWPSRVDRQVRFENQLEHVIGTYLRGNRRRSALQVAVFDPAQDHTHQRRRGFPCLQQVAFLPNSAAGTLAVSGVYALQNIYEKAYGNYLGLVHLGQFMAHELALTLTQVNCITSTAVLGELSKAGVRQVAAQVFS